MAKNDEDLEALGAIGYDEDEEDAAFKSLGAIDYQPSNEKSFKGFLSNIGTSSAGFFGGMKEAVEHPIKTVHALGSLGAGIVEKAIPGAPGGEWSEEKYADALAEFYKQRYGSWDNFVETLYNDPVGVLGDLSTAFSAGGGLLGKTAQLSKVAGATKTSGALAKTAQTARSAAALTDPLQAPLRTAALVTRKMPGLRGLPERMYQSALKPSLSKKNLPKIAGEIRTGLEAGIPVSRKGVNRLADLIDDLNEQITDVIASTSAGGPRIRLKPKARRPQIGTGAREMPPPKPGSYTRQTSVDEPVISATYSAPTHTTVGTGAGKFVTDFEKGKGRLVPINRNLPPVTTPEELIESSAANRGFKIAVQKAPVEGAPYATPWDARVKVSRTGENVNQPRVDYELEQAKNAQLIEAIEKRARDNGLLAAAQAYAKANDLPKPRRISDVFDIEVEGAIDPKTVAKRIDDLRESFMEQVNPQQDIADIEKVKQNFLQAHGRPMSYLEAQRIKQGTYRRLGKKYGQLSDATSEAEKALARGIKEELADRIPEISSLNAKESAYLDLQSVLKQAVERLKNRDIIGIGEPIAATAAAAATGSAKAGAGVGLIKIILGNPNVKSRLAIAINRAQQLNPRRFGVPNMATALARAQAYIDTLEDSITAAYQTPEEEEAQ